MHFVGESVLDPSEIQVPQRWVRLPVELRIPEGFSPDRPGTWPKVSGRMEYVGGRLLWMTPCGHVQQIVASALTATLERWSDDHPDFVIGSNEAGMLLGGDARGADAAVWRASDVRDAKGFHR